MRNDAEDPYSERRIYGSEIGVFEPFGPMYRGPETCVFYQKPAGYDVDVRLDRGWIVLCLGHCRSTNAIGSDRRIMAEAYGPSITYMPPDCDIRVEEDVSLTSDIVLLFPPIQTFEEAAELHGVRYGAMSYFWSEDANTGRLARSLRRLMLTADLHGSDPLEIETAVEHVVEYLLRLYAGETGRRHRQGSFGLTRRQIQRVSAFVDANLEETVTLAALAAEVGVSRHHFARQFRVATGASAYDYVLTKRIMKAMARLVDSDASLAEIALASGFYDNAHMSNQFARRIGVRPASYRRIMRM